MYRFFSLVTLILFSCNARNSEVGETQKSTLSEDLIGEWRNISLNVTMHSAHGVSDSVKVLEANESNWEAKVHIKPIQTFFERDGTYRSDHFNLNDSLLFSAVGTWTVSNDTLIMKQTSPNVAVYRLKTKISNDVATFAAVLDFDEDGAEDDNYFGTQKKFRAD